ncbi:hypothetical protein A5686_01210 [Mycobacterium sp. E2479]|nr:hypothetical protein A5686_01210 [Mycobacterium sp. E2479]
MVFAVVALFVVRVAAVSVALVAGSGVLVRSRIFMGWFGPRGIGSLVLGLLVVEQGNIHQAALIKQAVVVVVTISLLIHSLTAPVGIRLCRPRDTRVNMPSTQPPKLTSETRRLSRVGTKTADVLEPWRLTGA